MADSAENAARAPGAPSADRTTADDTDATIIDEITVAAHTHPHTSVVLHSEVRPESTTVGELFDDSIRVAAGLTGLGIRPGDVVAIQLPNWRECFIAHVGVWLCGAVVLPIVPIYGPREVEFIVRQSGARALIAAGQLRNRDITATLGALAEVSGLQHRIVVGPELSSTIPFAELSNSGATGFSPPRTVAAQQCLLVYTSGTTAEPKGVRHTHAGLLGELRAMDTLHPRTWGQAANLAVFPSGHIAGVLGVLRALSRPATTVTMDAWDPRAAARLIARHRLGTSAGAPIHLSGILDAAEQDALDLASLAEYTTGAAGVAGTLIRRAARRGIGAFRCYGSTEHPTISSGTAGDPLEKRADTDGRPCPGTEIRIVDAAGRDVDAGRDGEILSRGPELFAGYTDARYDRASLIDGWFHTGDIGRMDADGFLTITDRKKDIIVRGGENISSKEVEDVLAAHPAIAEVAAVGAPDEVYGERVCAFVVLKTGHQFGIDDATEHFQSAGLARQKTPERIVVVDELPRTPSGKVKKPELRERLR